MGAIHDRGRDHRHQFKSKGLIGFTDLRLHRFIGGPYLCLADALAGLSQHDILTDSGLAPLDGLAGDIDMTD
jgi:hypothetical protein